MSNLLLIVLLKRLIFPKLNSWLTSTTTITLFIKFTKRNSTNWSKEEKHFQDWLSQLLKNFPKFSNFLIWTKKKKLLGIIGNFWKINPRFPMRFWEILDGFLISSKDTWFLLGILMESVFMNYFVIQIYLQKFRKFKILLKKVKITCFMESLKMERSGGLIDTN